MQRLRDMTTATALLKTAVMFAIHLVALAVVLFVLLYFGPTCERMLADFGFELPAATKVTLALSYGAARYWYLLVLPVALDAIVLWLLQGTPPAARWLITAWFTFWLVAAMLFLAFAIFSLASPLNELFFQLSAQSQDGALVRLQGLISG